MAVTFPVALLAAGLVAAAFAFLTGFPVFRVRGDYLAIVTLGFGEVVRVLANNLQGLTNGPLGLKGLYPHTDLVVVLGGGGGHGLRSDGPGDSGWGRAMQAIREDETAARAMGVDLFRHLLLAYILSAFFFWGGRRLASHLITTISPSLFTFFLTFNLLIIIVVGGLGFTTGAIISAVIFTGAGEWLRIGEEPRVLWGHALPGIPGLRMVILSLVLLLVILYFRRGLLGRREFSCRLWGAGGAAGRFMALLQTEQLGIRFGGLLALEGPEPCRPGRRPLRTYRPQRRGQDHGFHLSAAF